MEYRYLDLFRGESLPETSADFFGLIVMGGPMSVYEADRYPFLTREQRLIRQAIAAQQPVLGICLGAQLIAGALGAEVFPGSEKEIGWYPVEVTNPEDELAAGLPSPFMAFHWHGDTFDLPAGALRLFRSRLYENQGFRWGANVYAFQFHFEVSGAMVEDWLQDEDCCGELAALPQSSPETIRRETGLWATQLEELSGKLFDRFFKKAAAGE